MPNYIVTISVDEDLLRYVTTNTIDPLDEIVYQELDSYGSSVAGIDILKVEKEDE